MGKLFKCNMLAKVVNSVEKGSYGSRCAIKTCTKGGLTEETKIQMSKLSTQVRNGRFTDTKGGICVAVHR